jgi:vitamin B12 transporter
MLLLAAALVGREAAGKIVDEAGNPLRGVLVSDGKGTVQSGRDGSFRIQTDADSLSLRRIGLKPQTISATWHSSPIVMLSQPIELPTVLVKAAYLDAFYGAPDLLELPIDPDRHYYSASQILEGTSGVDASAAALKGENQGVRVLGNLPRHSLVLLDGVPLNSGGESFDLSLLDVSTIESIQIVKNNASVYGGSSAIGGVVLITSKQAASSGYEYSSDLEVGSFGYARAVFNIRGTYPHWGWWLNISKFSADNDFPYELPDWWGTNADLVRENNAKTQNSLSTGFSYRGKDAVCTVQTDYEGFHRQLPGTVNFADVYRYAHLDGFSSRSRASLESTSQGFGSRILLWYNVNTSTYDNTRAPLPVFVTNYRQRTVQSGMRGSVDKSIGDWQAALSAETGRESFLNQDLIAGTDEASYAGDFSNATARLSRERDTGTLGYSASVASRWDLFEQDSHLSWRVESSLSHHGYLESKAGLTLGTAFSRPSPYDLFWKGDSQAIGNPSLKPERSRGGQFWLQTRWNTLTLRTALHHNSIDDLIQWRQVQMNGIAWKPFNIGKARIRNLEAEASWQAFPWLSLSASTLFTQALDLSVSTAERAPHLMYTPDRTHTVKIDAGTAKLRGWASFSHTGRQWTTPDNLLEPLQPFSILDAGIETRFQWLDWDISPRITVRNLMDSAYEVYPWVPQPGRTFYLGIGARGKW